MISIEILVSELLVIEAFQYTLYVLYFLITYLIDTYMDKMKNVLVLLYIQCMDLLSERFCVTGR